MVVQVKPTERDEMLAKQLMFRLERTQPACVTITESGTVGYVLKIRDNEVLLAVETVPDTPAELWYRLDEIELYEPGYD